MPRSAFASAESNAAIAAACIPVAPMRGGMSVVLICSVATDAESYMIAMLVYARAMT